MGGQRRPGRLRGGACWRAIDEKDKAEGGQESLQAECRPGRRDQPRRGGQRLSLKGLRTEVKFNVDLTEIVIDVSTQKVF